MMDEAVDGGDRHGGVWKICPIQLTFQRPFEPKATLMITQRPIFAVEVCTSWHSGGSRPMSVIQRLNFVPQMRTVRFCRLSTKIRRSLIER